MQVHRRLGKSKHSYTDFCQLFCMGNAQYRYLYMQIQRRVGKSQHSYTDFCQDVDSIKETTVQNHMYVFTICTVRSNEGCLVSYRLH